MCRNTTNSDRTNHANHQNETIGAESLKVLAMERETISVATGKVDGVVCHLH
jgi:hypothetical protein